MVENSGWNYRKTLEMQQMLREANPAFAQAEERSETGAQKFLESPLEALLDARNDVQGMPIASRFKHTGSIQSNEYNASDRSSGMTFYGHLSESEYKRQDLLNQLGRLRNEAILLAGKYKSILMDIEATKTEG